MGNCSSAIETVRATLRMRDNVGENDPPANPSGANQTSTVGVPVLPRPSVKAENSSPDSFEGSYKLHEILGMEFY